jgi:anti-sigma regulatory factor (Ser/Thr protein kinase)
MGVSVWGRRTPPAPCPHERTAAWRARPGSPAELAAQRRELRTALREGGLTGGADAGDRLLLVVEELASNALRHGRLPVEVTVTPVRLGWLVAVSDAAADRPPVPALDRPPDHGGMGLSLVARLCGSHGWDTADGCKVVWARVPYLEPIPADRVRTATDQALTLAARLAVTAARTAGALDALATRAELAGRADAAVRFRARATRARLEAEKARWAILTAAPPAARSRAG